MTDPGPENPAIRDQFPGRSPTTDRRRQHAAELGIVQQRAATYSKWRLGASSHARLLFAVADTISGVNMRLTPAASGRCTGTSSPSGPT